MNTNLSGSSLLDLKAELLKKREVFQKQKTSSLSNALKTANEPLLNNGRMNYHSLHDSIPSQSSSSSSKKPLFKKNPTGWSNSKEDSLRKGPSNDLREKSDKIFKEDLSHSEFSYVDEKALKLSYESLEKKSKLYESMLLKAQKAYSEGTDLYSSSEGESDTESYDIEKDYQKRIKKAQKLEERENILIDFSKKVIEGDLLNKNLSQVNFKEALSLEMDQNRTFKEDISHLNNEFLDNLNRNSLIQDIIGQKPDSSLSCIEYIDEFGRSRMITKDQAEKIQYQLNISKEAKDHMPNNESDKSDPIHNVSSIKSTTSRSNFTSNHYNPDNEVRTKGVGFYKFSQEESDRERQLNDLKKLDESYSIERHQNALIQDRRQERVNARLEKIHAKRKLMESSFPS